MPFLTLNGLTIPIAKGGQVQPQLIGGTSRAFDGALHVDNRGFKRAWKFRTTALKPSDAEIVRGLIQSSGDILRFENTLYSEKGQGPSATATGYTFRSRLAADGYQVNLERYSGNYAAAVEIVTTNILAADARDAEAAPAGYTAIGGAALAAEAAHYWQGTKSLKITPAGVGDGAYAGANPGAVAGTVFSGSVYIAGTSGRKIDVQLYDATNAVSGTAVTLTIGISNRWYRVQCTVTTGALACTDLRLRVMSNDGIATAFYTDGWQLEQHPVATSWVDGARADGSLVYSSAALQSSVGFTFAAHVRAPATTVGQDRFILAIPDATTGLEIQLLAPSGTNTVVLQVLGDAAIVTKAAAFDDAWHSVIISVNPLAAAGEHILSMWWDGVLVGTADPVLTMFYLTSTGPICVGCSASANSGFAGGILDTAILLPYPASTALVAAVYAGSAGTLTLPNVALDGDAIAEPGPLYVRGFVENEGYAQLTDGSTWRNNMRRIDFRLEEV